MSLEVDGQRYKEIEVMASEMETRLRESILRVLRPTLTQISELDHRQKELIARVEDHGRNIGKVDHLHHEVIKQGQLTRAMEETTNAMSDQVRDLENVYGQQYLDVKSTLDLQQSEFAEVKNDIVRLSREDSRIWDEASRLQQQHDEDVRHNKEAVSACHKRMDREREELDDRINVINNQREQLLEDLYGDDKGLTRLTRGLKELTDFASPIPSMLRRITDTERGMMTLTQKQESFEKEFAQNRIEWHEYVRQQDLDVAEMKASFKKQCNFLVAHNADIMRDIRRDYHLEIASVQDMRKEIGETLKRVVTTCDETEEKLEKEKLRIDRVQKEVKQEIREIAKSQLADRSKNNERAEKLRADLNEERELNAPSRAQMDTVSKLTGLLLEGCRVGCALAIQDFADRSQERWLCFPPERGNAADPLKLAELEKQRQVKEEPKRETPEVILDLRKGLTRSGYQPGQVHFSGHAFDRRDLLILQSRLLQKAQQSLANGEEKPLSKADPALTNLVGKAAPFAPAKEARAPLSARASSEARTSSFRSSTVLMAREGAEAKAQKGHSGSQSARAQRGKSNPAQPLNSTWQPGWPQREGGVRTLKQEQLGGDWVKLPTIAMGGRVVLEEPPKVATPPTSRPGTGAEQEAGH